MSLTKDRKASTKSNTESEQTTDKASVIYSLKGDRAFRRLKRAKSVNVKHLSLRSMPHLPQKSAQKTYKKHEPTKQAVEAKRTVLFVGIVVSKKVGNAVVRNKVRRRIKEGLVQLVKQYQLPQRSLDIVIIARPSAADADFEVLKQNVYAAMKKGNLL